ncbi:MAG: hypothetical protein JXA04_12060 [Gammaproteobacteria bacterium]|nr:hypothetical protein [Gammaproteobacteria bacterium]
MSEFPVPSLKYPIDVVQYAIPLPVALILANIACLALILGTLLYATITQLDRLPYEWYEMVVINLFGFLLPSFNLYATTRAMPISRWTLILNAVGVIILISILLFPDTPRLIDYIAFLMMPVLLIGVVMYLFIGYKHVNSYYLAIATGIITDQRLLEPILSEELVIKVSKILGSLSEIFVMMLAIFVFLMLFLGSPPYWR